MAQKTYKLKTTKEDLYNKGFRYNKNFSDDVDYYTLKFPVYKYKNTPVIDCELTVEPESGDVIINVFKSGTKNTYAPYFNNHFGGDNKVLDTVNRNIASKLRSLGAKVKKSKTA